MTAVLLVGGFRRKELHTALAFLRPGNRDFNQQCCKLVHSKWANGHLTQWVTQIFCSGGKVREAGVRGFNSRCEPKSLMLAYVEGRLKAPPFGFFGTIRLFI